MKIHLIDHQGDDEIMKVRNLIRIFDDNNNEFVINLNDSGELEVNGRIYVISQHSNEMLIDIPEGYEFVYEENKIRLIKSHNIEKNRIITELGKDIQALYDKYKDRLKGKFGVKCEFSFIPHRGMDGRLSDQLDNNQSVEIVGEEQIYDNREKS